MYFEDTGVVFSASCDALEGLAMLCCFSLVYHNPLRVT